MMRRTAIALWLLAACTADPSAELASITPVVEPPVPSIEPAAPAPAPRTDLPSFPEPPAETRCTRTHSCRSIANGFESIEIGPETEGREQQTIWNAHVPCRRQVVPIGAVSVSCHHRNVEGFEDLDAYVQYVRDEYGPEDAAVLDEHLTKYTWRQGPYQLDIQHHGDLRTYYVRMPTR